MDEQKDIPVCTLFKEVDDASSKDDIVVETSSPQELNTSSNSKLEASSSSQPEQRVKDEPIEEPGVCNIFQSVPSTEDLFGNITTQAQVVIQDQSKGQFNVSTTANKDEVQEVKSTVEAFETTLPADTPLHQNIIADDNAMVAKESDNVPNISIDQSDPLDEHTISKSETFESPFSNFDLMTSIRINDSLDSLSNLSLDQSEINPCNSRTINASETSEITTNTAIENKFPSTVVSSSNPSSKDVSMLPSKNDAMYADDPQPVQIETDNSKGDETLVSKVAFDVASTLNQSSEKSKNTEKDSLVKSEEPKTILVETEFLMPVESEVAVPSIANKTDIDTLTIGNDMPSDTPQPPAASALFCSGDEATPFGKIGDGSSATTEDIFTNALQTSEIDRRRDAWIPNEHTQTILNSVAQSQKRIKLEPKYLTRPGLATSESSGDPVKAVLARYKGILNTSQRKTLTVNDVPINKEGLQQLIKTGNYRAAIDLSGKVLTDLGQGFGCATQESKNTPETLKWWHARFSLLLRLKLYDMASTEFNQFGSFDTADLYFGFYPDLYPGRKGSMVPFSLRLLRADFPRHLNKPNEALSRLYAMRSTCDKILVHLRANKSEDGNVVALKPEDKQASITLWNERKIQILYCISNALLQLREYFSAINVLDEIILLAPRFSVAILSSIGRALLQLGDVKAAQQRFAQAERVAGKDPTHNVQLIMNRAFLYLGANNWKEALTQFSEVLQEDPTNINALNNKAVCLLYLCRLRDAITVQEEAVKLTNDSSKIQHFALSEEVSIEGAFSNLVTLYELESSKSLSKKQSLLQQVAMKCGDGFSVTCLKM